MPSPVSVLLIATLMLLPVPIAAQMVQTVQAVPGQTPDADALAAAMRRLASEPRDLDALIKAGELSLKLGDSTAAAALFARAEKIEPRSGRVRAGMASVLVESERPGEALRYFQQAEAFGYAGREFAGERGLAYDLVGEQERAQRDYRLVLKTAPDDETVRRYALSLGISGKREAALAQIDTLLRKSDRGAWRARAFILAMNDDVAGAERIVASMAPGLAAGLRPFLARLPRLGAADRAFAVHFGEVTASPARLADARLAPPLAPLAPEPGVATMVAANTVTPPAVVRTRERPARQRGRAARGGGGSNTVASAPLQIASPTPPAAVASTPSAPLPRAQPTAPVVVASTESRAPAANPGSPSRAWRTNRADLLFGRYGYTRERRPNSATPAPTPPPVAVVSAPAVPPPQQPVPTPARVVAASPPPAPAVVSPKPVAPAVALPRAVPIPEAPAVPTQVASAAPLAQGIESSVAVGSSVSADPSRPVSPAEPLAVAAVPVEPKQGEGSILASIIAGLPVPASELGVAPPASDIPPVPTSVATPPDGPEARGTEVAARAAAEKAIAEGRAADERAAQVRREAEERKAAAAKKAEEAKALAVTKAADEKALAAKKAAADKKAAAAKEAAEEKALAAKKAADEKKAASANAARVWVQVAGGAYEGDLPKAWAAVKAKAPALAGKQGYSTPLRATNRVVTGPFKSEDEAQAFVNTLGKQGVLGFVFTSAAGQKMTKLGPK